MTKCSFSPEHWQETLQKAQEMGYQFYSFTDWIRHHPDVKRSMIIRHDIDVSLVFAARIAKLESELNIRSTHFIRLYSKFYQLQNDKSKEYLRNLATMNAEIGLHYDRQYYDISGGNDNEMLAADVKLLADSINKPIFGCAGHRNGSRGPFNQTEIEKAGLLYEAYAAEFTKDRKYISDSAHRWREGCLCQWLGKVDHLTVLMHPVWWCEPVEAWENLLELIRKGD